MATITFKSAQAECRSIGMVLTNTGDDYRVNFNGGKEKTAYYTNDLQDAVDTARAMVKVVAIIDEEKSKPTVVHRTETVAQAEAWIAAHPDKAKVERGGFGIDGPTE